LNETFVRTEKLIGQEGLEKLQKSHVAVFGLGGVGGQAAEALVRSGIGQMDLIDFDVISESNLNRQILATREVIGKRKVITAYDRFTSINPNCQITPFDIRIDSETIKRFDFTIYDYVLDAIDMMSAKLLLIKTAYTAHTPIISSMGTGNKTDPSRFQVIDIYQTTFDPMARILRRELRKCNINSLKVIYSDEKPLPTNEIPSASEDESINNQGKPGRPLIGSLSFVPPAAGLLMASAVVHDLLNN